MKSQTLKRPKPEIEPGLKELLSSTRSVKAVREEWEREKVDLRRDARFVADCLKAQIVEDILRAMEEQGINKNILAKRLAKSRQYVGKVLNESANFTVGTLAEIACALDREITVRIRRK